MLDRRGGTYHLVHRSKPEIPFYPIYTVHPRIRNIHESLDLGICRLGTDKCARGGEGEVGRCVFLIFQLTSSAAEQSSGAEDGYCGESQNWLTRYPYWTIIGGSIVLDVIHESPHIDVVLRDQREKTKGPTSLLPPCLP